MNRKYIFGLLAALIVVPAIALAVMPGSMRSVFLSEFQHRTKLLFGHEPERVIPADGSTGLRIEKPEEYGGAPAEEPEEQTTESDETE